MRELTLDGSGWRTREDFYDTLLPALGAPDWHGRNLDALEETLRRGDINAVNPPLVIRITGAASMTDEVRLYVGRFFDVAADLRTSGVPLDTRLE